MIIVYMVYPKFRRISDAKFRSLGLFPMTEGLGEPGYEVQSRERARARERERFVFHAVSRFVWNLIPMRRVVKSRYMGRRGLVSCRFVQRGWFSPGRTTTASPEQFNSWYPRMFLHVLFHLDLLSFIPSSLRHFSEPALSRNLPSPTLLSAQDLEIQQPLRLAGSINISVSFFSWSVFFFFFRVATSAGHADRR